MATISDFQRRVENTRNRLSSFFIEDKSVDTSTEDPVFYNMGRITEASFDAEAVTSQRDQDGQTSTQLFDVEVSFSIQQTSQTELALLDFLAKGDRGADPNPYAAGHNIYISGSKQATADIGGTSAIYNDPDTDPDGLYLVNVLLNPGATIDLAGGDSIIPVSAQAMLELDQFEGLDTDKTITFSFE